MITAITLYLLSKEGSKINWFSIVVTMIALAQDLKLLFM